MLMDIYVNIRKENKMSKEKEWKQYHKTKEVLIKSVEDHLKSIKKVNIYNNGSKTDIPLNTDGDHSLMNEHMGVDIMESLITKIKKKVERIVL